MSIQASDLSATLRASETAYAILEFANTHLPRLPANNLVRQLALENTVLANMKLLVAMEETVALLPEARKAILHGETKFAEFAKTAEGIAARLPKLRELTLSAAREAAKLPVPAA
jgi:hypothetical protein